MAKGVPNRCPQCRAFVPLVKMGEHLKTCEKAADESDIKPLKPVINCEKCTRPIDRRGYKTHLRYCNGVADVAPKTKTVNGKKQAAEWTLSLTNGTANTIAMKVSGRVAKKMILLLFDF